MAAPNPNLFTNPRIIFSTSTTLGVDSSAALDGSIHARRASINIQFDDNDVTTFGDSFHAHAAGLGDWSAQIDFFTDFRSSGLGTTQGIDKTLFDLALNKIRFNIGIRPTNAARTSDNPEYTGPVTIFTHDPLSGEIGAPLMTPLQLRGAGNLQRLTSAS